MSDNASIELPSTAEIASWATREDAGLLSAFGHDVVASMSLLPEYDIKAVAHAAGYIGDAWLAEHDQTPVDAAWLESVLGPGDVSRDTERHWLADGDQRLYLLNRRDPTMDFGIRVDNCTRADVLGLLRWLKVPLKEQPR